MESVFTFKIALKYRKGLWRRIEIKGDQTLRDFDDIIRQAFNYDTWDHVSGFFSGLAWKSKELGEMIPDNSGFGEKRKINDLNLSKGNKMEYVYDFGANINHIIILEDIESLEHANDTPRIIAKSRTRIKYCTSCKHKGKKVKAIWDCIECYENTDKHVYLCDECVEEEHEDHFIEEILY